MKFGSIERTFILNLFAIIASVQRRGWCETLI
jgi:hypothetical protein